MKEEPAPSAKQPEILILGDEQPTYASAGAAGFDLRILGPVQVRPRQTVMVNTGLRLAVPEGYQLEIRSRSGLAKDGLIVANSPGTIDSDYRGEIQILLHNQSNLTKYLGKGDRVAQAVLMPAPQAKFKSVNELPSSERGEGGFGSTGKE